MTGSNTVTGSAVAERHRLTVRYLAAAASLVTAAIYLLIGFGVLEVVDETAAAEGTSLFEFGLMAGGAYVLGAMLLALFDRRWLWVLGAILQVGVIVMYVVVSQQRTPPFELWGVTIKVLQFVLLGALVYLSVRQPSPAHKPPMAHAAT